MTADRAADMETHVVPGARFVDPEGPRAHQGPRAARALRSSTASSTACTARRTSARRSTSPSIAATWPGDDIRRVDWRLYARTDRYYVKQYEADTNANFAVLLDVSKSMGFASQGVSKLEYGVVPGGVPGVSLAPAARSRRHHHVRRGHRHARAAVGEALQRAAAHARSREARAAGPAARDARQARRALQAPQHRRADLRPLREPGRSARGAEAVPVPRQRPRRVPRARSGRDRLSRTTMRRDSRISRAARKCRSCRRSSRSSTAR